MPKRYVCTSIYLKVFKKQMLKAANTDFFTPLVPIAHNKECKTTISFSK